MPRPRSFTIIAGEVAFDVPSVDGVGVIGLFSRDHLFGEVPEQEFPIESDHAFFMQISSAGEFSLATLLPPELDQQTLLNDLSIVTDGIGAVDLVYVPEPSCIHLLILALIVAFANRVPQSKFQMRTRDSISRTSSWPFNMVNT